MEIVDLPKMVEGEGGLVREADVGSMALPHTEGDSSSKDRFSSHSCPQTSLVLIF
jgi:hypothetical protein